MSKQKNSQSEMPPIADQTSFSAEEPLYENVSVPQDPQQKEVVTESSVPFYRTTKGMVGIVVGALLLVMLLLLVSVLFNQNQQQVVETASPQPSLQPVTSDPIQIRINQLSKDLNEVDPANDALPLPPVDLELVLEE
jgi:hypothetical protein